ncbi:hypothetical protein FE257_007946 [Aspergillus nanangensis]|uniref:Uncharacterized protein n=1 Tax=Aspergillus nanangensis TaxID=2582783 RepID=A0AAD4CXT8_ASPNN|nr:hypothetical protein FE257_007946 [Aspergillus nanangensis]
MSGVELIITLLETAGRTVIADYMDDEAAKQFIADIKEFMTYFTQYGYVEYILPRSYSTHSAIGWRTKPGKSVGIFYQMYPDIAAAIEQSGFRDSIVAEAGLDRPVALNLNSTRKDATVKQRIGTGWPPRLRDKVLRNADTNPFFDGSVTRDKKDIGRNCAEVLNNSTRAQGFAGAVVIRVLGLARVCGVYELSMADFLEMMANACLYEQLARNYIASLLGLDKINITRYGYQLPNGTTLGTRKNYTIPSEGNSGYFIHAGKIQQGRPILTYPAAVEDLQDVQIRVSKTTTLIEHEPILMDSAVATALSYRPCIKRKRTKAKSLTIGVLRDVGHGIMGKSATSRQKATKSDVHGNSLWQSQEAEPIIIRVSRSRGTGRLFAVIDTIGDYFWKWSAAGLIGKPCGCAKADPHKRIDDGRFRGIAITDVFCHSHATQTQLVPGYDSYQLHWVTGDLPLAMQKTGSYVMNMYVQVHGECLYCALNNAMAYGCTLVIAGGI